MRSAEYWAERAERVFLASEKKGTELNRALIGFYSDTSRQLQKEIDAFYGKYAVNNAISLEDARKRLNDTELKSFKEELGTYLSEVKRLGLGKDYEDYLRKLSSRAYISRQQELFAQARHQVEVLFGIQNAELEKTLVDAFHDSYYHTMFDVQQGLGFGSDFARLNTKQIEALIRKPWLGENYSDRVWNNKARLIKQLERVIPQAFALGENSRVLGKQLAERLGVSERAAVQLVRTEVNHAANEATIRSYREAGVEYFQLLATLDTRTSDICQSLDGKIFRATDAVVGINQPPLHPNCRSTTIPWFPPDELDGPDVRAARNSDGSYYTVPGNMNYREWHKKYVGGKLTHEEERAINSYIGAASYIINEKLRNGIPLDNMEREIANNLDSALEKLPTYEGEVTRSFFFTKTEDLDFFSKLVKNRGYQVAAYTSTTASVYDPKDSVRFIIHSKSGRDMRRYNESEQEILFARNTKFGLKDLKIVDGKPIVWLEEV